MLYALLYTPYMDCRACDAEVTLFDDLDEASASLRRMAEKAVAEEGIESYGISDFRAVTFNNDGSISHWNINRVS